jgi:hypothetical protein
LAPQSWERIWTGGRAGTLAGHHFMKKEQIEELLYQALETEQGGIKVYEAALRCVLNKDLAEEWQKLSGRDPPYGYFLVCVVDGGNFHDGLRSSPFEL